MATSAWSTQQLAEFVAAVSAAESEAAAALAAVERAAEALDADVAAIVNDREVIAVVGYPDGAAPADALAAAAAGVAPQGLEVPGVGACAASAVILEHPPGSTLVVARPLPHQLSPEEAGLLRGMARVASLTMRMLHLLDEERAARDELEELARGQTALRRVATLVAQAASPDAVFSAVAEEVAQLSGAEMAKVLRYEDDDTATVVGGWGDPDQRLPLGARLSVAGTGVAVDIRRTGRASRIMRVEGPHGSVAGAFHSAGIQTASGSPILVESRLWGVVIAASTAAQPLPPEAESRIPLFTELVAAAVANTQARLELRAVADEQAALRRVATQVARAASPAEVFACVAEEVGNVLASADVALVGRYDGDTFEVVGGWSQTGDTSWVGCRYNLGGHNVATLVSERNEPVHLDRLEDEEAVLTSVARGTGARSAAGAPINVAGSLWGVMTVGSFEPSGLPQGIEQRLAEFTDLVATAIANAQAQAELTASRARVVAAADETRRRIERDLHDGAQQRLVSLALQLRAAQLRVPGELDELVAELDEVTDGLANAVDELREYARGIHPALLAEHGLGSALKALARRSVVPVDLDVSIDERLPDRAEVCAYYVVSESLANTAKHARADRVAIAAEVVDGVLRLSVQDDGVGGAELDRGSGLLGLKDRVDALSGRMSLVSPSGKGTAIDVELPVGRGRESAP